MARDKMTISFSEYDKDISDFLREQKNASGLIRHLVREYMNGNPVVIQPKPTFTPKIEEEKSVVVDKIGGNRPSRPVRSPRENSNTEAIMGLEL